MLVFEEREKPEYQSTTVSSLLPFATGLLISGKRNIPKARQKFQLWNASFNGLLGFETLEEGGVLFG